MNTPTATPQNRLERVLPCVEESTSAHTDQVITIPHVAVNSAIMIAMGNNANLDNTVDGVACAFTFTTENTPNQANPYKTDIDARINTNTSVFSRPQTPTTQPTNQLNQPPRKH